MSFAGRSAQMRHRDRVRRALVRLSRDKWLSPQDTEDAAFAFALRLTNGHHGAATCVVRSAYDPACGAVGMVQGRPPLRQHERGFASLQIALRGRRTANKARNELATLKEVLKWIQH